MLKHATAMLKPETSLDKQSQRYQRNKKNEEHELRWVQYYSLNLSDYKIIFKKRLTLKRRVVV